MDGSDREYTSSEEDEVESCCPPINEEAELLCDVAERGDRATIECLLEAAVTVNLRNEEKKTPLHLAAAANNIETAQVLLQNNADINAGFLDDFYNKQTPLLEAIYARHPKMVQMLLEYGAQPDSDLLMKAAEFGTSEIVQLLLERGADVNSKNALHKAVIAGNTDTATLLLDHGASVNITARDSENALHKAAGSGKVEMVQILIEHGANINAVSCDDVTAWHKAAASGHLDIVQLLIQHGASINVKSKNGVTPLHKSVRSGNEELVKMLIKEGADINSADFRGAVPILIAVSEKQNNIARLLLSFGASVNTADVNGNSVLHQAIMSGSKELVLQILKESLNTVDSQGRSHLQLAVSLGDLDIAQLLVEWGANPNAIDSEGSPILHQAIEHGREETVTTLLNHGANVNACNFDGTTSLHLAMDKYGDFMAQVLLDNGANPNTVDPNGRSTLSKAVNLGNADLVVSLLEHGADVNYYDREGTTPLMYAVEQNSEETVKVLLDYGAIVNARNLKDQVPLHLTCSWTVVKLLLEKKAWANAKELYNEETPLLTRAKNLSRSTYDFYQQSSLDASSDFQWKAILKSGMSPWIANNVGETVLGILLSKNKLELSLSLVKAMQESNRGCINNLHTNGETLLHVACSHEGQEVIDYLLKNGAKANIQNRKKETPLHITCKKANETSRRNDEDLMTLDKSEQSLTETVYYWTARQLLAYGADPLFKDNQGLSCFDLARGNQELLDLLNRPVELMEVPQLLKWSSKSDNYRQKVRQIARGQRSLQVATFHYHIDPIGNGAFGHVYAGLDERDGREVAVKRLVKGDLRRRQDDREIRNLVELKDSAYVVKYLSCTSDEYFSYIILELMEGTLLEYMKIRTCTSDEQNVSMCKNIVMGLNYLHENKVLHRDIKPSNILYKTNPKLSLKIADFGLSIKTDFSSSCKTTVLHTNAGTPCWMAPELLKEAPGKIKHVEQTDIFACGLVLHFILAEQVHPFAPSDFKGRNKVDSENATQRNIMTHTLTLHNTLRTEAKHLIKEMLEEELSKRPRTVLVLQHPLFWSPKKKVSFVCALGNQTELEVPRHLVTSPSQVEKHLEECLGKDFDESPWDLKIPYLYADMTASRHRRYATSSAVDLVRFIRNSYSHVSDAQRTKPMKKLLLEDFIFFDKFPDLLMVVYEAVIREGWHSTREEIKYCLNEYSDNARP